MRWSSVNVKGYSPEHKRYHVLVLPAKEISARSWHELALWPPASVLDLPGSMSKAMTPGTKDLCLSLRLAHKENFCLSSQNYQCEQPGCAAAGIAPYMALELGVFDLMPKDLSPFVRGFSSAFMATTLCYPLDTVRYASRLLIYSSWPYTS